MSKSLDLRALKAFVATAREGSVSRAASSLNLTQPAVSLQLRQIAEQTGLKLFTRTSKGVLLTRDGAQLLSHAEKVLQAQAELMQAAYRMSASVRGTLRVGTILDPEFTRLGAFLRAVFGIAPEIRPELHQGMSGEVMSSVLAGNLDVGYAVVPDCSETDDAGGPGTTERAAADPVQLPCDRARWLGSSGPSSRLAGACAVALGADTGRVIAQPSPGIDSGAAWATAERGRPG
jgi:DNA-binding transcriptional LysR family regulator